MTTFPLYKLECYTKMGGALITILEVQLYFVAD